jgi:Tfp pilus assembly protein PilF
MGFLDNLFKGRSKMKQPKDQQAVQRHFKKGTQYGQNEKWRQAIAEFKAVVEIQPDHAGAHQMLALSYGAIMDRTSALRHYELLKKLDPKRAQQLAAQPAFAVLLKGDTFTAI